MSITTSRLPKVQERHSFFDTLPDGYYEADMQGNLLAANISLARLLGYDDPAKLIGRGYSRFLNASQPQEFTQAAQRLVRTGEAPPLIPLSVTRADGKERLFEVSIALLQNEAGKPARFHGIVRDITESARGTAQVLQAELEDLRQRYEEVSELEQLKTHMIRMTSHDLRSPLAIIGSYIELLDEDLAPHYGEMDGMYVNAIRQAVSRIMQLTTDILTLERLDQYREVTLMRVQLGTVLERTVNELAENSRQRNQSVTVNIDEPLAVYGDGVDLHEAIANLLGNAIKYTPEGGKIEARLRRDGDFAVLEIIDNGYGVPEDQQEHLFQPFQRIKTAETHMIEGTGLGLYLVKKIIEKHGGSMLFKSVYGEGSTFGFRLPLAKLVE